MSPHNSIPRHRDSLIITSGTLAAVTVPREKLYSAKRIVWVPIVTLQIVIRDGHIKRAFHANAFPREARDPRTPVTSDVIAHDDVSARELHAVRA